MKISIITTIYKAERELPRLLDSMMAQESSELEFFLIDNGSPDRCGEICEEYKKKDKRFVLYSIKDNIGYIQARNIGIRECSGDYFGFCDSDDYLEPGAYDYAVERIKESRCDLYIASYKLHNALSYTVCNPPYAKALYEASEIKNTILPSAFGPVNGIGQLHGFMWKQVFRRSIAINQNLTFIEYLKPYEDQIFNIDFIKLCNRIYVDDNIIYNYIVNDASITSILAKSYDYKGEYNRLISLYEEKLKRESAEEHTIANANTCFIMLLSQIVKLASSVEGYSSFIKEYNCVFDVTKVRNIVGVSHISKSAKFSFTRFCIMHNMFRLLYMILRLGLKIKR